MDAPSAVPSACTRWTGQTGETQRGLRAVMDQLQRLPWCHAPVPGFRLRWCFGGAKRAFWWRKAIGTAWPRDRPCTTDPALAEQLGARAAPRCFSPSSR